MSALKTGMVGGALRPTTAPPSQTRPTPPPSFISDNDLDDESVEHGDAIFSLLAITVYMLVGAVYFIPKFEWSGWEVMYFAFCTITTVGYGDYNGSQDRTTMVFTTVYAFVGKLNARLTHDRYRTIDLLCSQALA